MNQSLLLKKMLRMYFYLGELSKLSPSIFSIFLWVLLPNSTPQPDLLTCLPSAKWIFSYVMLRLLHCNICLKVLILDSLILLFIYLFISLFLYLFIYSILWPCHWVSANINHTILFSSTLCPDLILLLRITCNCTALLNTVSKLKNRTVSLEHKLNKSKVPNW